MPEDNRRGERPDQPPAAPRQAGETGRPQGPPSASGRPQGPPSASGRPQGPRPASGRPQGPRPASGRPQGPRPASGRSQGPRPAPGAPPPPGPPRGTAPAAKAAAGRKASDLKARLLTGVPLAAVVIGLGLVGPGALMGVLLVVVLVAQGEFYQALGKAGYRPATALGLVAGAAMLLGAYRRGIPAVPLVLFFTLALSYLWHAWGRRKGEALADLAVTILGVAYIPLLASFAAAALSRHDGRGVVLATIGAAAVYDICAYVGGRRFGRHLLAPRISPGKTREGAAVATVGVIVLVALLAPLVGPWNILQGAVFGMFVCIVAPLGDLFESVLKRDLGIKDMGSILPGHGGVLDRIDAILFCVPVSYLTLRLFGI